MAEQKASTAEEFPESEDYLMIFGGPEAYGDKCRLKMASCEVHTTDPVIPSYLRWSEVPITFDRHDHPKKVLHPGTYPLIMEPIVGTRRLSRVLMDGGSGLNIMCVEKPNALGIPREHLRPNPTPVHEIIPGHQAYPLGRCP